MNIGRLIRQIRLPKFEDNDKQLFVADYNKNAIPYFRLSVIIATIVSIPFAWLDLELIPSNLKFVWLIRFGIWLPVFAIGYFLSYKSIFVKHFQLIASVIVLIIGLGVTAMIFVSNKSDMAFTMYYSGIALIMLGVILFRLRFNASVIVLFILSFSYILTAIFKQSLLTLKEPINYIVVFYNNTVFLVSFNVIILFASYILEKYARNLFSQQLIIKDQNEELTASDEELRQNNEELIELNEYIKKQKNNIEKVHKHITESINYAKRIQQAMLPSKKIFETQFEDFFIFYRARDIVSGDFYWAEKVEDKIIYAVADCTGHGVPGAMVSMLGISLLNKIISQKSAKTASEILNGLRAEIKKSLKQTGKKSDGTRDGMDIALCIIDTTTNQLQFSGAYNSLYIFRGTELIELKADRQPIGFYPKEKQFTNNKFQLQTNDILYSFSDGFADQINTQNKRHTITRVKKLLFDIAPNKLPKQKEILQNEFSAWKGKGPQMDDVTVVGVKI